MNAEEKKYHCLITSFYLFSGSFANTHAHIVLLIQWINLQYIFNQICDIYQLDEWHRNIWRDLAYCKVLKQINSNFLVQMKGFSQRYHS